MVAMTVEYTFGSDVNLSHFLDYLEDNGMEYEHDPQGRTVAGIINDTGALAASDVAGVAQELGGIPGQMAP